MPRVWNETSKPCRKPTRRAPEGHGKNRVIQLPGVAQIVLDEKPDRTFLAFGLRPSITKLPLPWMRLMTPIRSSSARGARRLVMVDTPNISASRFCEGTFEPGGNVPS